MVILAKKDVGELKATVSLTTAEFQKGIKALGSQMSIIREEFKLATAGLDKVKDAMEISRLKSKSLSDQIAVQSKIVKQMSDAHKYASEKFGENSQQAMNYELKLKRATSALNGLERQLVTSNAELKKQGPTAAETAKKMQELGVTWENTGKKISDIGRGLTVALTAPILAGGAAGVKFNATMESLTTDFETMLGSAEKAKSMIADLTNFAKATPFEMAGLSDSAKTLLSFGVSAGDIMTDIKMLGDVSLGNQAKLSSLSLVFGQIQSTGRLMGQDLLQLVNVGFNPLKVISDKTGRSMKDLKKDMENGAISSDMVTDAFRSATSEGGLFYKGMERGSKTFNGQMSTMKDTINITLGEVMKPLFNEMSKKIIPEFTKKIDELGKDFNALSAEQKVSDDIIEGLRSNQFFTETRARATILTGLSSDVSTPIVAGDSILSAFGKLQAQLTTRPVLAANYTVPGGVPIQMAPSQVTNNGAGKIMITVDNHGYSNGTVLELSGMVPPGITKINNASFPLVHNKAYVTVMNKTTNTFEIAVPGSSTAIAYIESGLIGWSISKPVAGSVTLSGLDFNADGGEWDINISGNFVLNPIGGSTIIKFNDAMAGYYSNQVPYAYPGDKFYIGGASVRPYFDCNINIRVKRVSENKINIYALNTGINTATFGDSFVAINNWYSGYLSGEAFSNLTSFTIIPNTGSFVSGTKIIIKRV